MIDAYRTVTEPSAAKLSRKKSRFLSFVVPVESPHDVEQALSHLRKIHHDATHYCLAYRLLDGEQVQEHANDDGEPHGSAGNPILQQLEREELVNVVAVVIRYYGGTKLGVGGLVRAYGDAAQAAIEAATISMRHIEIEIRFSFPPDLTSTVMSTVHRQGVTIRGIEYDQQAHITAMLPPSRVEGFLGILRDATGARGEAEVKSDRFD